MSAATVSDDKEKLAKEIADLKDQEDKFRAKEKELEVTKICT